MKDLIRYKLEWFNRTETMDNFHAMVGSPDGAWVKYDAIKEYIPEEDCPECDETKVDLKDWVEIGGFKHCMYCGRKIS